MLRGGEVIGDRDLIKSLQYLKCVLVLHLHCHASDICDKYLHWRGEDCHFSSKVDCFQSQRAPRGQELCYTVKPSGLQVRISNRAKSLSCPVPFLKLCHLWANKLGCILILSTPPQDSSNHRGSKGVSPFPIPPLS